MTMRVTDTILGPARGDFITAFQFSYRMSEPQDAVVEYLKEIYRLAPLVGMDPAVLVAQSAHETENWRSPPWVNWLNPAGLGITRTGQDPGYRWQNGTGAARAQIVHMWVYTSGGNATPTVIRDYFGLDPRALAIFDKGWEATVRTIADLTGKWATDAVEPNDPLTYAEKIARKGNAIFPNIPDQGGNMARPTILLIAGHRSSNDAGNPDEKALTPALARAYRDALQAAGYSVTWMQEADGDSDPDDTVGGLDTVSWNAHEWAKARWNAGPKVLLDLHYEGSPARGHFAIIPDVTGLRTAVNITQLATDTWEHNTLDRELGRAWATQMRQLTGLPLRQGIREPGLMDESQTGVGGQGYRLATFAYTSPFASEMVRLVLEHGNHTHAEDRKLIYRDDFTQKCAKAIVTAVDAVYLGANPPPAPVPEPPKPPTFEYDPKDVWPNYGSGPVSRAWRSYVRQTGEWQKPDQPWNERQPDGSKIFRFDGGLVVRLLPDGKKAEVVKA